MTLLELLIMKYPDYNNKFSVFTVLGDGIRSGRQFPGERLTKLMKRMRYTYITTSSL